jgi:hypothetical protein
VGWVPDLRDLNLCLLGSWIKRYFNDEGNLWRDSIDVKYRTAEPNVFENKDRGVSQFWRGEMSAAKATKLVYTWKVGNGKRIRFWGR